MCTVGFFFFFLQNVFVTVLSAAEMNQQNYSRAKLRVWVTVSTPLAPFPFFLFGSESTGSTECAESERLTIRSLTLEEDARHLKACF